MVITGKQMALVLKRRKQPPRILTMPMSSVDPWPPEIRDIVENARVKMLELTRVPKEYLGK